MQKKTIVIAGYYGFENIGDEAILTSILSNLSERQPNLQFIVVSGNPVQTSRLYKVRSVLWTDIPAIMDACQEADLILLGGGGLFHDYWGTTEEHLLTQSHSGISFYSAFPILAKLYGKPCVLYALGVGPLLTEAGKNLTKQSFEYAAAGTVRDEESLNLLKDLGIKTTHVKITADAVFNLPSTNAHANKFIADIKTSASPLITISLRDWTLENAPANWHKEVASALDLFTEKYNASFLFLPFQVSPERPLTDDLIVSQKVVSYMQYAEKTAIFQEQITPEIVNGIISQADLVLGMRLHSLIFAVKEAIPFVGLIYDPKVENLINATNMQEFSLKMPEINAEKLFELLNTAWVKRADIKSQLSKKSISLKKIASQNAELVIEQLNQPYAASEMQFEELQELLLKQTRKLAESEKTAHALWLQIQPPKEQKEIKSVTIPSNQPAVFEPSSIQLQSYRPDIICFSIIDWEFRYQRPQQMMAQFAAQGRRVFYISISRFQAYNESVRVEFIRKNIYEIQLSAHHIPDLYGENIGEENLSPMLSSLEQLIDMFQIKAALGYVMIASWQKIAFEARNRFGWKVIYDCMDEWDNFPLIKSPILEAELRLVQDCDLLAVTSQILFDKWSAENHPIILARNAADYDFYQRFFSPNNLLNEKKPIVGYYGALADWFDLELMIYTAQSRPEYTFVLLGGIFDLDVSELITLPNVKLLGQQPYETMPQYLFHFDVCIIPFKINPITEATDPVKIYEYMCGGKPVVSVALPEIMPYQELLYIAQTQEDFVKNIDKALAEDTPELQIRRKHFAQQNSWHKRVLSIDDTLQALAENQIDSRNPLPLVLPQEFISSSRLLTKHDGIEYWQREYKKAGVIYKQLPLNLGRHEFNLLSSLKSAYFPELTEYTEEADFSLLIYKADYGQNLEDVLPSITSSAEKFYEFISHCLNLLGELRNANLLHRNIQRNNVFVKDNKPFLREALWAVSNHEDSFHPFGLGGSERPKDGSFSDVYSMGKILEYINRHQYPAFEPAVNLMVSDDSAIQVNDIETLKLLFQLAYPAQELHSPKDALLLELLEKITRNLQKIENRFYTEDNLRNQLFRLQQESKTLGASLNANTAHMEGLTSTIEGLISTISQKDSEIEAIRNSNTWKLATQFQRISNIFLSRK